MLLLSTRADWFVHLEGIERGWQVNEQEIAFWTKQGALEIWNSAGKRLTLSVEPRDLDDPACMGLGNGSYVLVDRGGSLEFWF
jgi:hypothetical protein